MNPNNIFKFYNSEEHEMLHSIILLVMDKYDIPGIRAIRKGNKIKISFGLDALEVSKWKFDDEREN